MVTTPLPLASAAWNTSSPSTSRTYCRVRGAGHSQMQALSAKLFPTSPRVRPTSASRSAAPSSGKHFARLMRTTSRERFGSFHSSQPSAAPRRCTAGQGRAATSRNAPTTRAPLIFSTGFSGGWTEGGHCNPPPDTAPAPAAEAPAPVPRGTSPSSGRPTHASPEPPSRAPTPPAAPRSAACRPIRAPTQPAPSVILAAFTQASEQVIS